MLIIGLFLSTLLMPQSLFPEIPSTIDGLVNLDLASCRASVERWEDLALREQAEIKTKDAEIVKLKAELAEKKASGSFQFQEKCTWPGCNISSDAVPMLWPPPRMALPLEIK
jgi:hypothetical protein